MAEHRCNGDTGSFPVRPTTHGAAVRKIEGFAQMSESVALSALHDGDLPSLLEWIAETGSADRFDQFDMIEGPAVIVQIGRTNVYQIGRNHLDVHVHDTVDEAAQCYLATRERYVDAASPDNPVKALVTALMGGTDGTASVEQFKSQLAQLAQLAGGAGNLRQAAMPYGDDNPGTGMYV